MFEQDGVNSPLDMSQRRLKEAKSPLPTEDAPPADSRQVRRARDRRNQDLDSADMLDLHAKLLALHRRELDRQFENRAEQSIDEDFYDNIQYNEADAQTLKDRGQLPLVYNVIATSLNWVTGTEKRSRMDYKILPRRKEDSKPAERKTALMKYLSDVNRTPFARSRAFEDAIKVGVGWLECGVEDSDAGDPLYARYESWRNILWDTAAVERDLLDARFIERSKWVDADILGAMFEDRAEVIRESIDHDNIYATGIEADGDEAMDAREIANDQTRGSMRDPLEGINRDRCRVMEMWYRKPVRSNKLIGGPFSGDLYDFSEAHDNEIRSGRARIESKKGMRIYCALFTARGFLWHGPSPYRHNRFPFTPIWAYLRGRDGMPYGMIRGLRDIQTDINKRASKALYILSSNKVVMDEDALPDDVTMEEFEDEVARPDAIIRKRKGSQLELNVEREMAQAHLELMSRSIAMIQSASGVTDELMGRKTNAVSGIAIQRRQDQGSTATTNLFDNLRFATQVHGEKELSLIEQFQTEQKDFRITSMRGTPEYVTVNSGLPEDDITRTKADFIISESDWHASTRQAAAESLLETIKLLAPALPQVALAMVDLVVENMDVPNRDEIVKRIRSATGLPDPDAEGPTPEMIAAEQAKQAQQALQMRGAMAEVAVKEANAVKIKAQADQAVSLARKTLLDARAVLATLVGTNVASQSAALDAALKVLQTPDSTPVADHILAEAGFEGEPERKAKAAAFLSAIDQSRQPPQGLPAPAQDGGGAPGIGVAPPPNQGSVPMGA